MRSAERVEDDEPGHAPEVSDVARRQLVPARTTDARDLGVGRRKLERHFNADLGVPPADASIRIRLAQARMLLSRSDRTVTRIAEETGFCDASHLIRVFRESQGITPDQWRQQALAGQDVPSSAIPELAAR